MTVVRSFLGYGILALIFVGAIALHATQEPVRPLWESSWGPLVVFGLIATREAWTKQAANPGPVAPFVAKAIGLSIAFLAVFELGGLLLHPWAVTQPWIAPVVIGAWTLVMAFGAVSWVIGQPRRIGKLIAAGQVLVAILALLLAGLALRGDLPAGASLLALTGPVVIYLLERLRRRYAAPTALTPADA